MLQILRCTPLLAMLVLVGCVERQIVIESVPAGAEVFWDGFPVGQTPVTVEFHHYGTHELLLRHEGTESESGTDTYAPHLELIEIPVPWYQHFPIDLLAELWPAEIIDRHEHQVTMNRTDTSRELDPFEARATAEGVFPEPAEEEPSEAEPSAAASSEEGGANDR